MNTHNATLESIGPVTGPILSQDANFQLGDADDAVTVNDTHCDDTLEWLANARVMLAGAILDLVIHCDLPSCPAVKQLLSAVSDQDRIALIGPSVEAAGQDESLSLVRRDALNAVSGALAAADHLFGRYLLNPTAVGPLDLYGAGNTLEDALTRLNEAFEQQDNEKR